MSSSIKGWNRTEVLNLWYVKRFENPIYVSRKYKKKQQQINKSGNPSWERKNLGTYNQCTKKLQLYYN
jgi:hypothetical protein